MFGLFKKPDSKKSVDECLEVWALISDKDKATSVNNIYKYTMYLYENCSDPHGALLKIGELKQGVIGQYQLKDHRHPAFMQLQILSDYIFSKKQGGSSHIYAENAFAKITSSLESEKKIEMSKMLKKFI